jgi:hypothetical protein
MTVAQLRREMDSKEFTEWIAYEQIDPGEPERSDLRAALMACTVANAHKGARGRLYKISDFLLKFKTPRKEPNQKSIKTKLQYWLTNYRAQRKREKIGGR